MPLKPVSSGPSSRIAGDSGAEKRTTRRYTLSLSFSGLVTSVIIMIIAVGWIFAFGVIVGRGYNPEKKLPELARLLPPPEGTQKETAKEQSILKPEELLFMTELKQHPPAAKEVENKPAVKTATKQPQQVQQVSTPVPPQTVDTKNLYDFVFQAVAYKNRDQADKLRERMEGEGLRTRLSIEKDSRGRPKWFRVQVLVRGTDADAVAAKQVLKRLGLHDAHQASKKPVERKR